LLAEDLQADHAAVNAILDGTWSTTFWAQQFMPWDMFQSYRQLKAGPAEAAPRKFARRSPAASTLADPASRRKSAPASQIRHP
jgi:hypothetical protein